MSEHDRYHWIDGKLRGIVESTSPAPSWYHDFSRLGPDATEEERLAVFQAIRTSGCMPEEAGFFLVSWQIDEIATRDADDTLQVYEERLESLETAYRLDEGGIWPAGAAPERYDELRREYRQAWDEVFAKKMEQFGEHDMARLFREDYGRFEALSEAGRQFFAGPTPIEDIAPVVWIRGLVESIARCMKVLRPTGPLEFRYDQAGSSWNIEVYPTGVELVGGASDGEIVAAEFSLDVEQIRDVFDQIDSLEWRCFSLPQGGLRLLIEGRYLDREVVVSILARAPDGQQPGMKLDVFRNRRRRSS